MTIDTTKNETIVSSLKYQGKIVDWAVKESQHCASESGQNATSACYDVSVERIGENIYTTLLAHGVEIARVMVEIDRGVPTVHVSDTLDHALHLHLAHGGFVITPDSDGILFKPAPIDTYSYDVRGSLLVKPKGSAPALSDVRGEVFDRLFDGYDFNCEIVSTGGKFHTESGDTSGFVLGMGVNGEEAGGTRRFVFKVRFQVDAAIPVEVYALDLDSGEEVGRAG